MMLFCSLHSDAAYIHHSTHNQLSFQHHADQLHLDNWTKMNEEGNGFCVCLWWWCYWTMVEVLTPVSSNGNGRATRRQRASSWWPLTSLCLCEKEKKQINKEKDTVRRHLLRFFKFDKIKIKWWKEVNTVQVLYEYFTGCLVMMTYGYVPTHLQVDICMYLWICTVSTYQVAFI